MSRSPRWPLMVLSLGLGLVLTAGLVAFDRVVGASLEREALLQQEARADHLADQLHTHLQAAKQATRTLATLAAPLRERSAVESLARGTLASTPPEDAYGVGVWFAPYALEPRSRWVGTYAHREADESSRIVVTYEWSTPAYDYHRRPWYQQGLKAAGAPFLTEPYFDVDRVYASFLLPILDADGTQRGVVSVDILLPRLRALVTRANRTVRESFYVVTRSGRLFAHPREESLVAWARAQGRLGSRGVLSDLTLEDLRAYEAAHGLSGDPRTDTAPVWDAGWTVYVSTDTDHLFAAAHRLHAIVQGVGLLMWGGLLAGLVVGVRTLRVRDLSRELLEREREREALERSERMLREVLETSLDGVAAVDGEGRLVEWNGSAERMFGWSRNDVLGQPAVELVCRPEDRPVRREQLARLVDSGGAALPSCRLEALAMRRDGAVFPVEASLAAVRADDGTFRVYAFVSDVTGRHQAEEERRRMLERQRDLLAQLRRRSGELRAIMDNMLEGVFVADQDGQLSFVNQAGMRMCGESACAPDAKTPVIGSLRDMEGVPLRREDLPLFRALRGEVVRECDLRASKPGGERVLRMNAAPIPDEDGRVSAAVVVIHDITEAVEFDRLKDEFVRMAAHELKTPVTVMKSFAQLALRTAAGRDATLARMLEGIDRGANRIDQVVRTLLDVSQLHLRRMQLVEESLDVGSLVAETARRLSETRQGARISVHGEGPLLVWGDPARLEQVFVALLDNALRYSPPDAPVEVVLAARGEAAEVCIRDRGIGIPSAKQARLFHRFYRPHSGTEHDRGGLGVGLYIAREIIQQHGGRLTLESREGEGTTVHVRLPLLAARAPGKARSSPDEQEGASA
ncbi:PAS domain S-box protein [Pyxidicoccus fallax]|uniref:histidine kinase n=1 Tax=Pyxidicoccus fallax TaxID=394095 RepID=A0A848LKF2_9BACT|nr:PAS domain S-box protein [Pyxidicoccus fallax]NMO18247.1 PAS domain S-box protein [Pyxidicoccus fallax]NPC79993.1 PAS domain S-box protein [Pyxidicoccus fallax]